jgi:cyanate lyase
MIIEVAGTEILIDITALKLSQEKLPEHLANEAALLGYYAIKHAEAASVLNDLEDQLDYAIGINYQTYKKSGEVSSDKMAESMARTSPDVVAITKEIVKAKKNKDILWAYLKALDKNHENALNMAYNSRRELSALKSTYVPHEN